MPAKGKLGRTALQAAAGKGEIDLVEQLIQLGTDVNAPPSEEAGATALQFVAMHGYTGIISVLLNAGAISFAGKAAKDGLTALEGAAEQGRLDMVRLLLDFGEAIGSLAEKYVEARDLAEKAGHAVIADIIRNADSFMLVKQT
ncbi:uncharacterized protein EKO05_0008063 [Ascochyta rabiei]|uniref:uncharacterized protein n=1 Tax=Didymella rabiei TaxID=5454 RepID=UPI0021FFE08D|nr:uncharacterized protein EKO05_0008063 [Ascochyta rabiei]UPX17723.1 hypothetical protein EKO05_0008063 [Ascochyta rabiei]